MTIKKTTKIVTTIESILLNRCIAADVEKIIVRPQLNWSAGRVNASHESAYILERRVIF